ncbi:MULTISPECIES: DUF6348 family protein [Thermomonosporaceae]|uniref:DUF6348 family protein n=1 Tax=Thermomonosporaceae TaxID=2012 RepID=UPI00255A971C|nr:MULTISPECIES: DUF6348 family protein [Thermomonosporaceae]MDL4773887.1 DUF6348 family protein [Actinomadura xylanilytica]
MESAEQEIAGHVARMLGEGHGLPVTLDGAAVDITGTGIRVAVGAPETYLEGRTIRIPIGIAHPSWNGMFAWDQTVGTRGADRHPVAEALDGWAHNVFAVFAAALLPSSDLARRVTALPITSGSETADVYYGALAMRDFGGFTDADREAIASRPPTMVLIEELFGGYALPDRPVWVYTYCARMPDGPVTEVTVLNGDSSESFGHIADHLPWHGHGSVKSWALVVPRPTA